MQLRGHSRPGIPPVCLPAVASNLWSHTSPSNMSQIPGKPSYSKAQWLWHQPHRLRITEHPHLDVLTEHEHSQPWIYRGEKKEWSTGGALLPSFFPQNWAVCKNKGQRVITELTDTWDSHQMMFKQDLRTCLHHKGISRPKQSCLLWCLLSHLSKMNYS